MDEAKAKNLDSPYLRTCVYGLAFLRNDAAGMKEQVAFASGKPGFEDWLLGLEAATATYSGRIERARTLYREAVASANRAQEKELAAYYEAAPALNEALFGNEAEARQRAAVALRLSTGRDVRYKAALALAVAGDASRAQVVADDLGEHFPKNTVAQFNYLPTLHAQIALDRKDAPRAIEALHAAASYELGDELYPAYFRGLAYIAAHRGSEAASEFQKILDHRGIVWNAPIGALTHLQIGRAYVLQGDNAKARAAYQDFLSLWKDADPDIPILKQAKAEYAKLQ